MDVESVKYGDICDKCAYCDYCDMATFGGHNPRITACSHFSQSKQTNADRIRSMSDAEIADFLCDIGECDRRCPAKIGDCFFSDSACRSAWRDWLKQEVKDD